MRKLLIAILLFSISQAKGQVNVGPKVGFQAFQANLVFDEDKSTYKNEWSVGYNFGGYLSTMVTESFGLATELYYSRKGKKTTIIESDWINKATYHFVEAPILFQYRFEPTEHDGIPMQWYANVGPYFSYWLGGSGEVSRGAIVPYKIKFNQDQSANDVMNIVDGNRLQVGVALGGGVIINSIGHQKFIFDLRAYFAHSTLGKEGGVDLPILGFSDTLEASYRLINVSVIYTLEIDVQQTKKGKSSLQKRLKKKR